MTTSSISAPPGPARAGRTLRTTLLLLAGIAVGVFGWTLYRSAIHPLFGYGDEDMGWFRDADPRALAGGDLTSFHKGWLPFEQEAPNLPWQLSAQFDRGDGLFERKFGFPAGFPERIPKYGAGPHYNATSCDTCHVNDGRARPPASEDEPMTGMFLRMSVPDGQGGWKAPDGYHGQLRDRGAPGVRPEGIGRVRYEEIPGSFADGEPYTLLKPHYRVEAPGYGPLPDDLILEARVAPPVHGMGLLEAIAERDILAYAASEKPDGVKGKPNWLTDPETGRRVMGRFSLKANQPSLRVQSAGASFDDMGVTSPVFPREGCLPNQDDCLAAPSNTFPGEPELSEEELTDLAVYLQLLAVPARRNLDDPLATRGEALFAQAGCASCHVPTWQTGDDHPQRRLRGQTIHPYTDLLLHDMGPGLAGRPDHEATATEWRTPPLWGIGLTELTNGHTRFLHDGRARNLEEAILWHGGEAEAAQQRYRHLSKEERQALLRFLESI
ncbi:di-heme oxidoreductase family protein [Pseudothauera rhizosphaerae]|uniref:C-type cytochrome n=1 Tax=Pseudothauera rhizosphaerae TaxID=2565932 RepID=A0A4S4ASH7_9RHOO|nr:di-heme oxidoredictase family protein [Pseudothauera rhizosphaerae]THF62678.1 c-type cytochrome [Pseudothauera rhizosphaerae]